MANASELLGSSTPPVWVTGTTYAQGKVVLSPVDFCYYVRKVAGAGSTDPSADTTNWQVTGRAIKSIQRGTGSPTATSVTVASVNTAKSELRLTGYGKDSGGIVQAVLYGYLANSTTITVNGNAAYTGGGGFSWELTEYY